jgi:hypothetical protein
MPQQWLVHHFLVGIPAVVDAQRGEGRRKLYQLHELSLLRIGRHMSIDYLLR